MFQGSKILTDEGTTDVQVLIDYIQRDLGGVIGEGYLDQNGAGRITITQASGPDGDGDGSGDADTGDTPSNTPGGAGGDAGAGDGSDSADGSDASDDENGTFASTGDSPTLISACLASAIASLAVIAIAVRRAALLRRQ